MTIEARREYLKAIRLRYKNSTRGQRSRMARDRQHQSTLWSGWKGTLTHATLLSGVLSKITDITGLDNFAQK